MNDAVSSFKRRRWRYPPECGLNNAAHEWRKRSRIFRYLAESRVPVVVAGWAYAPRTRVAPERPCLEASGHLGKNTEFTSEWTLGARAPASRHSPVSPLWSYGGVLSGGRVGASTG